MQDDLTEVISNNYKINTLDSIIHLLLLCILNIIIFDEIGLFEALRILLIVENPYHYANFSDKNFIEKNESKWKKENTKLFESILMKHLLL